MLPSILLARCDVITACEGVAFLYIHDTAMDSKHHQPTPDWLRPVPPKFNGIGPLPPPEPEVPPPVPPASEHVDSWRGLVDRVKRAKGPAKLDALGAWDDPGAPGGQGVFAVVQWGIPVGMTGRADPHWLDDEQLPACMPFDRSAVFAVLRRHHAVKGGDSILVEVVPSYDMAGPGYESISLRLVVPYLPGEREQQAEALLQRRDGRKAPEVVADSPDVAALRAELARMQEDAKRRADAEAHAKEMERLMDPLRRELADLRAQSAAKTSNPLDMIALLEAREERAEKRLRETLAEERDRNREHQESLLDALNQNRGGSDEYDEEEEDDPLERTLERLSELASSVFAPAELRELEEAGITKDKLPKVLKLIKRDPGAVKQLLELAEAEDDA